MTDLANLVAAQEMETARRETAFQHWVMTCNQDVEQVSRKTGFRTADIEKWAAEDQWSVKARQFMAGIDEDHRFKMLMNIQFGADEGLQYMRDVAGGRIEPNRERLQAAKDLAHMAGFAPNTNNRPEPLKKNPNTPQKAAIRGMNEDELAALEAEIKDRHADLNKEAFDRGVRRY